ncbi:MAG: TIGR03936 family radical SAM-associated protein [Dehalococcoidia bacterium]|nr:TIGR03936 family radical SAM-associated protein [Dehalococcoidia bacterium]
MNRLRIRFKRGEEIKYISHLDLVRVWQRAFRRAGVELVYSEGFNPHPRLSLAAPLALGVTSSCELMDVYITQSLSGHALTYIVTPQLPAGLEIEQVAAIPIESPTLQSQLRFAEYAVQIQATDASLVKQSIDDLLAKDSVPWEHRRDVGVKSYDLRPLIEDVWLISYNAGLVTLGMKLRCDSGGAGRPEQVVRALGQDRPLAIQRTRLFCQS